MNEICWDGVNSLTWKRGIHEEKRIKKRKPKRKYDKKHVKKKKKKTQSLSLVDNIFISVVDN